MRGIRQHGDWLSSDSPPPLEYWYKTFTEETLDVYIRREGRKWFVVDYAPGDRSNYLVLAGPFPTLRAAQVAWRLRFPG